MPRLTRPLNKTAVRAANVDFYARHPEIKGKSITKYPKLEQEWRSLYIQHGGTEETKTPSTACKPSEVVQSCPAQAKGKSCGIEWQKQPGASDEDLTKAKQQWEDAKKRRLPDGSKPKTVKAMEAIENSDKKTIITIGGSGNSSEPNNWDDAKTPAKGSGSTIKFNPNKLGNLGDGVQRDPESSLAHEAYHSYEISEGKLTTVDMQKNAEVNATAAENEHRVSKGLDQRKKYGAWDVPQYK